jgi:hypothetical protein
MPIDGPSPPVDEHSILQVIVTRRFLQEVEMAVGIFFNAVALGGLDFVDLLSAPHLIESKKTGASSRHSCE